MKVRGKPKYVLLRGEVIVDHEKFVGKPGMGQFLRRKPFSPLNV
jgi:dihydropyrimidinase